MTPFATGLGLLLLAGSAKATPAQVRAAGASWAQALRAGKVKRVGGHYTHDSVLLGTFSEAPRGDKASRRAYFQGLTDKDKLRVHFDDDDHVTMLSPTSATRSGHYTFSYEANGERVDVPARYTFVLQKQRSGKEGRDRWMILTHHSSVVPGGK